MAEVVAPPHNLTMLLSHVLSLVKWYFILLVFSYISPILRTFTTYPWSHLTTKPRLRASNMLEKSHLQAVNATCFRCVVGSRRKQLWYEIDRRGALRL